MEEYLSENTTIATLEAFFERGLGLIMSDLNAFVEFTSSGLFSGEGNFTIGSERGLDVALQSLITSTANNQDHTYVNLVNGLGLNITIP